MRVLAAMSGGVDSAVAAARAVDAGHDVTGVHLALSQQPAVLPHRRARLLHPRGRPRRAPRRRRASASRSTSGTSPSGSARTWSTTSSPSTPRAAPRTRACAATRRSSSRPCSTRRSRSASTPSCTGHYARLGRDADGRRAAPRGGHGQGPVLRARRADPGPARARDVPARRHAQGRGPRRGRASAGSPSPTSPTATTSASSPTATPAASSPSSCAEANRAGAIVDSTGEQVGDARGRVRASPSASAAGCASARRPPTASRATCSTSTPVTNTVTVGPAEELEVDGLTGDQAALVRRRRRDGRCECTVQLRAHGAEHRAVRQRSPTRLVEVELLEPPRESPPARRSCVYDGTRVVGSATISATRRAAVELPVSARATGIGSMPGEDFARGHQDGARRAARPAAPARASGSRRDRRHDRSRHGPGRRARLRPPAGRLAADRRTGRRPPAGTLAAGPGPRRAGGADPGVRRAAEGPGRRAVDARRDRREAARRQGALRRRRPPRPRPGPGCRCAPTTSPTCSGGCPAPPLVLQVDEPMLPSVLAGRVSDRLRLPPAPLGRQRRCRPGAGVGARGGGGGPVRRALLRRGRAGVAVPLRRGGRSLGRPRRPRGRGLRRPGHRASTRAARPGSAWCRHAARTPRRRGRRSTGRDVCWTCSVSTRRRSPTGWCSRPPAGWPAPSRRTRSRRCAPSGRPRPSSAEPGAEHCRSSGPGGSCGGATFSLVQRV